MRLSLNPRARVQLGLIAFLLIVGGLALIRANKDSFASIAYPPIPDSHYKFITDAVRHCGVPFSKRGLIAAIAWKESTFHADSQSGAGAVGVMQVLRGTGFGIAQEYQIGGLNSATFTDPAIGYKMGTCYYHSLITNLGGNSPNAWTDDRILKAALIGYNAGPGRGQSFLASSYNGPVSSLGYAERILQASRVYSLDFARYDQQANTSAVDVLNQNVRSLVWPIFLKQDARPEAIE